MTATIYNGRGAPDAARTVSFSLPAGDSSGLALTLDFLCNRIPAEIDGLTVTALGRDALADCAFMTRVTLPISPSR